MNLQYEPAGRALLKISGVLMIVFGAFGLLVYTLGLAAVLGLSYATGGIFSATGDLIGMSLLLAGALTELIAGILGSKAAKKPARAGKSLYVWGGLSLLLGLAGMGLIALRAAASAPFWRLALGLALSLVLPIVYLASAARLRRSLRPEDDGEESAEDGAEDAE